MDGDECERDPNEAQERIQEERPEVTVCERQSLEEERPHTEEACNEAQSHVDEKRLAAEVDAVEDQRFEQDRTKTREEPRLAEEVAADQQVQLKAEEVRLDVEAAAAEEQRLSDEQIVAEERRAQADEERLATEAIASEQRTQLKAQEARAAVEAAALEIVADEECLAGDTAAVEEESLREERLNGKEDHVAAEEADAEQHALLKVEEARFSTKEAVAVEVGAAEEQRLRQERMKAEEERFAAEAAEVEKQRLKEERAQAEKERLAIEAAAAEKERCEEARLKAEEESLAADVATEEQRTTQKQMKLEEEPVSAKVAAVEVPMTKEDQPSKHRWSKEEYHCIFTPEGSPELLSRKPSFPVDGQETHAARQMQSVIASLVAEESENALPNERREPAGRAKRVSLGETETELIDEDSDEDDMCTKERKAEASKLIDMGFKIGESHRALAQASDLNEAVGVLLEKDSPSPADAIWNAITSWFVDPPVNYTAGKYTIVGDKVGISSTVELGETQSCIEKGKVVHIVEIKRLVERGRWDVEYVRGKLEDGHWISLTRGDLIFAEKVPLVDQIMELGFSEEEALEAAKRCSTTEAAVEFLTHRQES